MIRCIRSPFWPPEASEWKDRARCEGWPDKDTINLVIKNGCHVVNVAHTDCRGDDFQWRISFSKAEVILIRSWSPDQQLVYHLLRYFAKRELIRKEWRNKDEILSTYSLKTLMLWQCEQRPWSWWNSRSLIEICCNLLKIMFYWLKEKNCKHYFIRNCNLFDREMNESNLNIVLSKLLEYTYTNRLTDWFERNYLQVWNDNRAELTISEVFGNNAYNETPKYDFKRIHSIVNQLLIHQIGLKPIIPQAFCVKHLGLIENELFVDFYKSHIMLQVLTHNRTHEKHDSLIAMLCTLFFKYPRFNEEVSALQSIARKRYVMVAEYILKGCTSVNDIDHYLQMKLARILIKKELQLSRDHPITPTKYCELFFIAALDYAMKCYESSLKYIKILSPNIGTSKCEQMIEVGRRFLFIDEVAFVIGLLSLVEYSRGGQTQKMKDHGKSTSMNFFHAWIFDACHISRHSYVTYVNPAVTCPLTTATELCLHAILVYKSQKAQRDKRRIMHDMTPPTGPILPNHDSDNIEVSEKDNFLDLITKCAVLHLIQCYQSLKIKFSNLIGTKTESQYKALYWYSQKRYDLVLKLCDDILKEKRCEELKKLFESLNSYYDLMYLQLQYEVITPSFLFPFQELYDPDVATLLGLTLLIKISFFYFDAHCTTGQQFIRYIRRSRPFISTIFIARYLRVRCLIKCNRQKRSLLDAIRELQSGDLLFIEKSLTMFTVFKIHRGML